MAWYHFKPKKAENFIELAETYNEKYGDYDYAQDSRALDGTFAARLIEAVGNLENKSIIVCGANSGYEIKLLAGHYPNARFTAVDISDAALRKISHALGVNIVHANMESLPFGDASFDVYLNCRAIQSSNVDLHRALSEAVRITNGRIIISIPNGYFSRGKILKGLYDYDKRHVDKEKPLLIARGVQEFLEKRGSEIAMTQSDGEIFLTANKSNL